MTATVRTPPQDLDAERALLGAMMAEPDHAALPVRSDDWYSAEHAGIHAAIVSLYGAGKPTDPTAVAAEMQRAGTLPKVGGHLAVFDVAEAGVAASAPHYAEIVRGHGLVRRIQSAAFRMAEEGYAAVADPKEFADRAQASVFAATEDATTGRLVPIGVLVRAVVDALERSYRGEDVDLGVPFGIASIDNLLGPMRGGNLVLVAARPSLGKSSFAFQVAREAAVTGRRVLLWSIEMSAQEVALRMVAGIARLDLKRLGMARLNPAEWGRAVGAVESLDSLAITVVEGAGTTPLDVRAAARRVKPDLVVLDYVQLLTYPGRHEHRESEVSAISRSLKAMAMELHVPVLALAQLNRESERANRAPALSDLRDSGSLEQDADVVVLLSQETGGVVVAHVAKHRNGPTGKARLRFVPSYTVFEEGGA